MVSQKIKKTRGMVTQEKKRPRGVGIGKKGDGLERLVNVYNSDNIIIWSPF